MSIKAIFYDFDGVIKESTQIKTIAFYKLYIKYGRDIAEKAKQHHIEHGGISRFEKFKLYHKEFLDIDLNESGISDLAQQFSDIVMDQVIKAPYVPGALEAITELHQTYDQFVVTGTPQNEIKEIASELSIAKYFKGFYGSPKDKITLSQEILDAYGYSSAEVLFIGDATTDERAADHHKFHFILREHKENEELFAKKEVIKTKDLTNLEELIKKL
jgi:phosphoglycolate phosphatase-like HAD superfamily hydrolase